MSYHIVNHDKTLQVAKIVIEKKRLNFNLKQAKRFKVEKKNVKTPII